MTKYTTFIVSDFIPFLLEQIGEISEVDKKEIIDLVMKIRNPTNRNAFQKQIPFC